jgi:WD40 repeat protein
MTRAGMSVDNPAYPPTDTWAAAVHLSERDYKPLGAAVLIDSRRLLTCRHVVVTADQKVREQLWVAFPTAACPRQRVELVEVVDEHAPDGLVNDLAMLTLYEPVPAGVERAPLRIPIPRDMIGRRWWAFGFPPGLPQGNTSDGSVGSALGYGWIRLETSSTYPIQDGFSGAGLWSPDYKAVVGIVGQASGSGDGLAITMHQADKCFPDHGIESLVGWSASESDEAALAQWGWALARDPEGIRHWRPRARGVTIESDPGYRFRGRTAALTKIVECLDRPTPDRRVLVVTGSPGVGKSAVLGRIVTTADADICAELPPDDRAVRATTGSVHCAVHAKSKTADEVAEEIARSASARLPGQAAELAPAVHEALSSGTRRFNVIIDALDEAAGPDQARDIVDKIVLPLARTCADVGVQVIVGTRRQEDNGDLPNRFGSALEHIDLDDRRYFEQQDLAAYALACLQLTGEERDGNPYADLQVAGPLASKIAAMSDRNFLIAGLIARSHGLHDDEAVRPEGLEFTATVDAALDSYLRRLGPVATLSASSALTALAFADAPGMPLHLWRLAIRAMYGIEVDDDDLDRFARSSAANFLVESGGQSTTADSTPSAERVIRLFHQALSDALLRARSRVAQPAADQRAIALALADHGKLTGWDHPSAYLLRSLPSHADAAGLVDALLRDDAYLLKADLRRLMQVADDAVTSAGRERARLIRMTPQAIGARPAERAALFSVTEALEHLGAGYRTADREAPYHARWASAPPRLERAVLEGHESGVNRVCKVMVRGKYLLASAGDDGTVRIWDPATGEERSVLRGHEGLVKGLCRISIGDSEMLVSSGDDGTVRIWDPVAGVDHAVLRGHNRGVNCVCPVAVAGRQLIASAGQDETIRLWDPDTGEQRAVLIGHRLWVTSVCQVTIAGQDLLASAGYDGTIRIWDLVSGEQRALLEGHQGWITCICRVTVAGTQLLVSAGADRTVRIWDPAVGRRLGVLSGHEDWVTSVCPVSLAGQTAIASASNDRTVRIWDPVATRQRAVLRGHQSWVTSVCPVSVSGRPTLASAGDDGTVRIWDFERDLPESSLPGQDTKVTRVCPITVLGQPMLASTWSADTIRIWAADTGEPGATLRGHQGPINGLCPVTVAGRPSLASAGNDGTVRIWDPASGEQRATLPGHIGGPNDICAVRFDGHELLAIAGADRMVRIWNVATMEAWAVLSGHEEWVASVCPATAAGRPALASADNNGTIRIWDLASHEQTAVLLGHEGSVTSLCEVVVAGQPALASASHDGTIRIWDPSAGRQRTVLQGHQAWVTGVCPVSLNDRPALASAGNDRTVRIWDPETGICLLTVPTHYQALSVSWQADELAIGLTAGILVIRLRGNRPGGQP